VTATDTNGQHGSSFYVTATALYLPLVGTANVAKYDRAHTLQWTLAMSQAATEKIGAAAIAADGGIIVAASMGDKLTRMMATGTRAWVKDVVAPGIPITTSSGLVVLSASKQGAPSVCAFRIDNGDEAWCTPGFTGVTDLIAGDDGVIYAATSAGPDVYGLDGATGAIRYTFRNVGPVAEMLLRNGQLYAWGSGTLTAFTVPAMHYDASSWPVRFHDNQRTRGTRATLEY
jgi:outer membrane protein assembly factor BamB